MRINFLNWFVGLFFLGAIAFVGIVGLAVYGLYNYPHLATYFVSAPSPQDSPQTYSLDLSVANRSKYILTPVETNTSPDGSLSNEKNNQQFTATNTVSPTSTKQIFSATPTATNTQTPTSYVSPTQTITEGQEYPAINTAIPYEPVKSTTFPNPTATKTKPPYFSPTVSILSAPTNTKTPVPTSTNPPKIQSPSATNTPTILAPTATEIIGSVPSPPNTKTPQVVSLPTSTFTASPTVISSPTFTFTPTPTPNSGPTPTVDLSNCSYSNHGYYENELLGYINQLRQENGLSPLNMQSQLRGAAREHSNDMACNNFVSHTGTNGTTNHDRILAYGYSYSWRGENIYMGWNATPAVAFDWWINSEPHLKNLLNSNFIHIGIGHSVSGNRNAYTLVFARP
jgi:uncharacterized protein YkwD